MNFNPKGLLFQLALAAAAVNAGLAFGPVVGMVVFLVLALEILVFG